MRASTLLLAGLLLGAATAATAQSIAVEKPSCMPMEDNGLVQGHRHLARPRASRRASTSAGGTTRTSTGWPWRWSPAATTGRRRRSPSCATSRSRSTPPWSTPPARPVARSESQVVPVTRDCRVQLSPKERGVAENLTVGETSPKQQGKKVLAFLCDGVVTRVNSAGVRRSDEVCRACVVAWWQRKAVLIAGHRRHRRRGRHRPGARALPLPPVTAVPLCHLLATLPHP